MINNKRGQLWTKLYKVIIGIALLVVILLVFYTPLEGMVKDTIQVTSPEPDCGMRTGSLSLGITSPENGKTYSPDNEIEFIANPEEYCTIDSYEWELDKKTIGREQSFKKKIDKKGTHSIILKINYNNGNTEEWKAEIIIN